MKFVSKMSNLRIILKPGIQAQPITGTPAVPTLYVQFRDGLANVDDPDLIERMERHPGFNSDFIKIDEGSADPYAANRAPSEPVHVIAEIEHGKVKNRNVPPIANPGADKVKEMIETRAKEIALELLPEMIKAMAAHQPAEALDDTEDLPAEATEVASAPTKTAAKKTTKSK